MNIAIDIGHAAGTGSTGNGLEEHAVARAIAEELASILIAHGQTVAVIDYPQKSNAEDLAATVRAINAGGFDISVSVHADASDSETACGAHVCYHPASMLGKALASAIAAPLCELMPGRAEAISPRPNLYVLRKTACPAVLVECGFLTNKSDAAVLKNKPRSIAQAIAFGIEEYAAPKKS